MNASDLVQRPDLRRIFMALTSGKGLSGYKRIDDVADDLTDTAAYILVLEAWLREAVADNHWITYRGIYNRPVCRHCGAEVNETEDGIDYECHHAHRCLVAKIAAVVPKAGV